MSEPKEFRVFGPPGTGKTTFLSRQVAGAAEKYGSDAVLVASFTRTAAAELAGRDLPLERQQVGTLHSHAYRALGRPLVTAKIIDEFNKANPSLAMSSKTADLDEPNNEGKRDGDKPGDKLSNEYHRLRAVMRPRELWAQPEVLVFAEAWEAFKADTGAVDFSDMIQLCLDNVDCAPGNPIVGFYDEVQDFVPMQLALIRKWAAQMEYVVLAGDDDQALYEWIGATPDAWLDYEIPAEHRRVLARSYRVPRAIHEKASAWAGRIARREEKAYEPRLLESGEVAEGEVRLLPATWKLPEAAVWDAESYLSKGKSVMFLASCSYMLVPLIQHLRAHGIPFQNQYRRHRGDWNPLPRSRGVTAAERLLCYLRPRPEVWGEASREWNPEELRRWLDVIQAKGVLRHGAKTRLEGVSSAEPIEWLIGLDPYFEIDAAVEAIDCSLDWFEAHLTGEGAKRMQFPLAVARMQGAAALREEPRITVGTIHSVKGGEKDVVYLFPDLSPQGYEQWGSPGAGRDSVLRQFYVGMTRARESLIVCGSAGLGVEGLVA